MQALGLPFCRVCRQVIWNRIGPLAVLCRAHARRSPFSPDTPSIWMCSRVASDGRTMSNWWEQATRLGRMVSRARWDRLAGRRRLAGHGGRALRRAPRHVHGRDGQPGLQRVVERQPAAGMAGSRSPASSAGLARPSMSSPATTITSICSRRHPTGGHVDVVGCADGMGFVVSRAWAASPPPAHR